MKNSKIQNALNFKEGILPIDFGSTPVTGIHISLVDQLRRHFGLEEKPVKVAEPYQMLGEIDDDLKELMGIDVNAVEGEKNFFGIPRKDWKPFTTTWGQDVLVPGDFNTTRDNKGDIFIYPEGDISVPPSAKMPASGAFFDSLNRQKEDFEDYLKPEDNLEEFSLLSEREIDYFVKETERVSAQKKGVMATFGGTAIGDIALVPAPWLKDPKGVRDITEWYMSTALRQDFLHDVFSRQVEIAIANLEVLNKRIGPGMIDAVYICGTDFGTQTSSFCSVETYEALYAPYYKKMNRWVHNNTDWKTFKHSCGAVRDFIPSFIDSGFDILNPLQFSATGMDPVEIKREFGKDLVFWGGGVDTQKTLPFGTPDEVRSQVLERCEILSRGGGFVFNTIHNIQAQTPIENVVAMLDALKEFTK